MSGDLYRDAHLGIRARLAELDARIGERETEVTPAFWEMIAPELHDQLASMRNGGRELASSDSLDELARAESMLATYLGELDRMIAGLPAIESEWLQLPDDVPDPPTTPVLSHYGDPSAEQVEDVLRALTAIVRERARDAEITSEGSMHIARFRERDCPFSLRAAVYTDNGQLLSEVDMWLVTSIPRALPPLVLRHESLFLSVGSALGLRHDVEVGDPSFDGLFLIEGTNEAATLYLSPAVRAQLLALARFDVPTLHVDPSSRTASLRWRFEPAAKALDAAVRVLIAIRESRPNVRFRT